MKNLTFILLFLPISLMAQKYVVSKTMDMEVQGTSTLHDWEMTSEKGSGTAYMTIENGTLKGITSLSFKMKAETLKSGKGTMDDISYEALKTEKNPYITFTLRDVKSITEVNGKWKIVGIGDMTIAGKTNSETVTVTAEKKGDSFVFKGTHKVKMTEFNMKPPTAMFGTIKTGDDLKIVFTVTYQGNTNTNP